MGFHDKLQTTAEMRGSSELTQTLSILGDNMHKFTKKLLIITEFSFTRLPVAVGV